MWIPIHLQRGLILIAAFTGMAALGGCKEEAAPPPGAGPVTPAGRSTARPGPDTSGVQVDMTKGWCGGHGVPESVCTRCNASLIAQFKAAGDWCAEHGLPESQCTNCHPEVKAKWAALEPGKQQPAAGESGETKPQATTQPGAAGGALPAEDWCDEHGVPESVCTRCNPALIAKFKEAHDWCEEHRLPESQCAICNPQLKAMWAAKRPKRAAAERAAPDNGFRAELPPRILTGENDPVCQVDLMRVRLRDPSIAQKAGIRVEPAGLRRMAAAIEVPGEVVFDQTRTSRLTAQMPGVVRALPVKVGDRVAVNDILAVIESPALGEAQSRYIELRETQLLAAAEYQRVTAIREGTAQMLKICRPEVPAEDVRRQLAEIRIGEGKSRLLRAHAALELARSNAAREARLSEQKISTQESLEAARAALATAAAEFSGIREEIEFVTERDYLSAQREIQVANSALGAAERRLRILGLGDEAITGLGSASHDHLSRYELRSPVAGRVIEWDVAVGEAVDDKTPLLTVSDLSRVWLLIYLPERNLLQVRVGQRVLFTIDGVPGVGFQGRLEWIASRVDDRTRTVRLRAELDNDAGVLRANMFGRARIVLHDNDEALTVPSEAVQTDGCCQLVFVRQDEDLFLPRKVSLGAQAGGYAEVLAGLRAGEPVVTAGSFLMKTEILKRNIGAGCCEVDPGR